MESDFIFGINLGAPHQVEGSHAKNDYPLPTLPIGWWSDPELFTKDLQLAKDLGVSTVRLGVEWARVEPEPRKYYGPVLRRYADMIHEVRDAGLEPMVNLHHFTLPNHIAEKGGWTNSQIVTDFFYYFSSVMNKIQDDVGSILTINEPSVQITNGYLKGMWPPFERSPIKAILALRNMASAHHWVHHTVHFWNNGINVGATEAIRGFSPANPLATREARFREFFWNTLFFRLTHNDFYGVNYFRDYPLKTGSAKEPVGFKASVKRFAKSLPEKPIIITENGINDPLDQLRPQLLKNNIRAVFELRDEGIPIQGFLPWTLTDNYEWFEPLGSCRMGLVEVDFQTGKRTPRPSLRTYQEIIHARD